MSIYYYSKLITHEGLNKTKLVKAESEEELKRKCDELTTKWEEQYQKQLVREKRINDIEDLLSEAESLNEEAEENQHDLENILLDSLNFAEYSFDDMKSTAKYSCLAPVKPMPEEFPSEPQRDEERFNPKPGFFTKIIPKKLEEFKQMSENRFLEAHQEWELAKETILNKNKIKDDEYQLALKKWEEKKEKFYSNQSLKNKSIDEMEDNFRAGDAHAVENFYQLVLENIEYPCDLEIEYETAYNPESKILIVNILLPNISDLPKIKSVSPVKKDLKLKYSYYSESALNKMYDLVNYQIVLRTLKAIYSINSNYNVIESVVINGRLHTIDPSTGNEIEPYILSLNIKIEDFGKLNLNNIEPRAWFKSVKGISAPSLATVTPIQPILQLNREDKRFVEGYEVAGDLDSSTNLAAMDWQDFENLIRELFESEFNENGGEVKITQASRDGGVDAVVFDPDPIRGGKIVLQAKRYTNIVGVSAVRDLYGTVINEGAMKGILITTANYGSDAYAFAKDKPISLLTGANLLSLLEKHGHKARIDISEAKRLMNK